eukprot:TRINITY_DN20897_c0_g1_i1.p1 TRINITY_DN20897_c0_g1~~TRINITY_DN20897_c0_g1_i1.p1  ORF type:complete len:183 (+),score=39.58 TRINITY_DN20897_c0_g1_i1:174-722(+)
MAALIGKLQLKPGMKLIVSKAPPELSKDLQALSKAVGSAKPDLASAYLYFVRSDAELEKLAAPAAKKAGEDGLLWIAHPKKTSKKYVSEMSRNHSFKAFGRHDFEMVRQISLDDDWSCIRLRSVAKIKAMTRSKGFCLTASGKRKTTDASVTKSPTMKSLVKKHVMKSSARNKVAHKGASKK